MHVYFSKEILVPKRCYLYTSIVIPQRMLNYIYEGSHMLRDGMQEQINYAGCERKELSTLLFHILIIICSSTFRFGLFHQILQIFEGAVQVM